MEEENATMDKEADMNVDQELSLVYRKILHFIPSLLLPTSRGFLVYMMVRFILIRQELHYSGLPGHIIFEFILIMI